MLSPVFRTLAEIEKSGVIACLRADDGNLALEAARAALDGGVTCVLQRLLEEYPSLTIGVGTVLSVEDARKAVDVGAKFLVSPGTVMEILLNLQGGDVLYIPGVMTPTEVLSAYNAGARSVKVYPVSVLGGDKYISTLKRPFPHIPMIASQGITIDSVERYMEAGATAVVLSDAIFEKEAMRKRDFNAVYRLARLATLEGSRNICNIFE